MKYSPDNKTQFNIWLPTELVKRIRIAAIEQSTRPWKLIQPLIEKAFPADTKPKK